MAVLIDGKALAAKIRGQIAETAARMETPPCLAVVLVGDDPASKIYVRNKKRACENCGFRSVSREMPASSTTEEVVETVRSLTVDPTVDAILVQLPLPEGIDRRAVIEAIDPEKDADMIHPVNLGRLASGVKGLAPCTPAGIMRMLEEYGIDPAGKNCVVVGRSELVGRPAALLLTGKNGTVTVCHSRTGDLAAETRRADILVAAVGVPRLIRGDMVKPGAAVIDVGINRMEDGKICGDVDFDDVEPVAGYLTPVPGGCGPMTIAMLMQNTLELAKRRR